jgi:UPF0755 protein
VTRREQDALTDYDPHAALFGDDDEGRDPRPYRPTRADRRAYEREQDHDHEHSHRRRSRRGWLIILFTVLVIIAVAALVVPRVIDYFKTDDYSGNGASYPTVTITVHSGDSASDIGDSLHNAGVVASTKAFTNAASDNAKSASIQPGAYDLHQHQSGASALTALLDPSSRNAANDVLVTEGANVYTVLDRLTKVLGADSKPAIAKALAKPTDLGLPVTYDDNGKAPSSAEGFLYPATYTIDPGTKPEAALNQMVTRFIQADRDSGFAAAAKEAGITPYEALKVASIIQAEARFDEDMPKVAEVIYNRMKANTALQIDATTKYGCEIANEAHCVYNNFPTPYNSYLHAGLPPTPIDNPGAQAMDAAVHPAKGTLKFYVNGDADGHLSFSTNESDFQRAVDKCRANNWGCA